MQFFIKNKFLLAVLSLFILISGCNSLPKIPKPDIFIKSYDKNKQIYCLKGLKYLNADVAERFLNIAEGID